ncbi:MAG TPA: hypothetical protein VNB06_00070 [Thermoanaerobaculia bacterium]|nr:hypothetical protein [Thermoanaerobaculia bacterium]
MLRQYGDKHVDAVTKIEDLIAKDERAATLAKEHVPGIPPRRWYPAELEDFLPLVAILDAE